MLKKKTPPVTKKANEGDDTSQVPEAPYREIFEYSAVPTVIIEEDSIISLVNNKFEDLSGFARREIEGKKEWQEFVSSEDREKLSTYHREMIKPDGWAPAYYSFCFIDREGKRTASHVSVRKIPGTTKLVASITDTTIQMRLEGLLRANEKRYRVLVNNLSLGVYKNRLENPGKFLWANPALIQMFGFDSLADLIRRPVADGYPDPRERERFLEELTSTGYVKDFEVRMKKKDGSPFWVKISALPKKNRNGEIEWVEGTVENINACKVAIQTCRQDNQYLREVLESAVTVGIICTDEAGTIIFFSRGAEQMLGYSSEEAVQKQSPLIIHITEELAARGRVQATAEGPPVTGFEILVRQAITAGFEEREWTYVRKDTARITVNLTVTRIQNDYGEARGFLFTAKEITDRKRLEEAFRFSNLQMSGVINNLPEAMFAIDREGKVIAWNRAMEIITGVRAVEILGRGNYEYSVPFYGTRRPMLIDLISEPDSRIEEWGYTKIRRKGNAVTAETPALDQASMPRVLWTIAAPIFDSAGERAGAIESLADVTERRRMEAALQDSVSRFRQILDNTGSATAIIEEDDTFSYINPEFERVLGYVREEVEGKKKWMEFVAPDDILQMQNYREKRRSDPESVPSRYEFRFIRWDGEVRNGYLTITRIPDTQKIVIALFDITDKVLAEKSVHLANKKLNFFNRITRHDILNQLTVLKGNLELSKEQENDATRRVVLEKELAAANEIQALIMFTRDYQDIGISPPEWQALVTTIRNSCTGIRLGSVSLSLEIQGVEVYADRLFEKVFFHLITNALSHGEKITGIRISCKESFEELHVICEDDGIGVPPDAKEKIFNREYFKRTGLYMYLTREILSITGITIRETGTYGRGARFEIHVPKGGYRFASSL
jgi:PAS domain S-box-containing protein